MTKSIHISSLGQLFCFFQSTKLYFYFIFKNKTSNETFKCNDYYGRKDVQYRGTVGEWVARRTEGVTYVRKRLCAADDDYCLIHIGFY